MGEIEDVLLCRTNDTIPGEKDDRFITFGYTSGGRHLAVAWIHVLDDPRTVYPVTAYDAPERLRLPRTRKRR